MINKRPIISIILSIYNAEKTIEKCLNGIFGIEYDKKKIELILSNDASKDNTMEYVKKIDDKHKKQYKKLVIVSPKEEGGVSATRNRGLKEVQGDFIVFIDSDVIVPKNFLTATLRHFEDEKVGGVAIGCPFGVNSNVIVKYYESTKISEEIVENAIIGTGATIYSVKSTKGLKFDERIFFPSYEDGDFALSVMERGYKTIANPKIISVHLRRTSLKKEMRVMYRKGVDIPLVLSKHPNRKRSTKRSMIMNLMFATSLFFILPFIFISSFYYIKSAKSLQKNKLKYAYIGVLLDLSKSFGLIRGLIKWRKYW